MLPLPTVCWARLVPEGSKDGSQTSSPSSVLGFRPKNVTVEMVRRPKRDDVVRALPLPQVETIHNMFPDIPRCVRLCLARL